MFREFFDFLKKYGVIGLAIGVIIGGKFNELLGSFVNDLLMPLVFQPALKAANVEDIRKLSYNGILYGKLLGTTIDFMIVAFIVFAFCKFALKEETIAKK